MLPGKIVPTNKNQHFVPRCHLRPFSLDQEARCIDLFNIDRMSLIRAAALKHQCSGDYFYGEDSAVDAAIQETESAYSMVLRDLLRPGARASSSHKDLMRIFWLFQYLRTEAAAKKAVEMLDGVAAQFGPAAPDFNMGIKEAVLEAMDMFASEINMMDDMNVAFGRNKTNTPLLTSDNPAILCNRWVQHDPICKGQSIGLVSAGNIMIMPLTPQVVFLGYDASIYQVQKSRGWFSISKEEDIHAFNQLQVLNCNANLYVAPGSSEADIHKMVAEVRSRRPAASHKTQCFVKAAEHEGYTKWRKAKTSEIEDDEEIVVQVEPILPRPRRWPSCLRWRPQGRAFTNGSAVGYVRQSVASARSDPTFRAVPIRRGRSR